MSSISPNPETPATHVLMTAEAQIPLVCRTILLVEDEGFVREVTCDILRTVGYRVLKARHAAEAMRVFRRYGEEVHVLVTDVVMPGQNGRDLARDLLALCLGLRTIFISGYPENAVTRNGIQQPGACYLPKPFSVESLTRKIEEVLREYPEAAPRKRRRRAGNE